MRAIRLAALTGAATLAMNAPGQAGVNIIGAGINGSYAGTGDTSLWSLVDGVTLGSAPGDDNKNAILHDYVVATGSNGTRSVFSLGEINPAFGGTNLAPYVALSGGKYSLVDPNSDASGRDVSNLTSLQVVTVPSLPVGKGGESTSVNLSGLVTNPGKYTQSNLKNDFTPMQETVSGHNYTGVPVWTFIHPSSLTNVTSQVVVTTGTDGYEIVLSLAELDPSLGGNPQNLLPYADTAVNSGTTPDFPLDGVARTILPLDNKHGRWVSNLVSVEVTAVPEPSTWMMALLGFAGVGLLARRRTRRRGLGAAA